MNGFINNPIVILLMLVLSISSSHADVGNLSPMDATVFPNPETVKPDHVRYFQEYDADTKQFRKEFSGIYTGNPLQGTTHTKPLYKLYYKNNIPFAFEKVTSSITESNPYSYHEITYFNTQWNRFKKIRRYAASDVLLTKTFPEKKGIGAEVHQYYDDLERVTHMDVFVTFQKDTPPVLILSRVFVEGKSAYSTYHAPLQDVQWLIDILNDHSVHDSVPYQDLIHASESFKPVGTKIRWYVRAEIDPFQSFQTILEGEQPEPTHVPTDLFKVMFNDANQVVAIEQGTLENTFGWKIEYRNDQKMKTIYTYQNNSPSTSTQFIYGYDDHLLRSETYNAEGNADGRWYYFRNNLVTSIEDYSNDQSVRKMHIFTRVEPSEFYQDVLLRVVPEEKKYFLEFKQSIWGLTDECTQKAFDRFDGKQLGTQGMHWGSPPLFYKWIGYYLGEAMYALHEIGSQSDAEVHRIHFMKNSQGIQQVILIRQFLLDEPIEENAPPFYGRNIGATLVYFEDEQRNVSQIQVGFFHHYLEPLELPFIELPGKLAFDIDPNRYDQPDGIVHYSEGFIGKEAMLRLIHTFFPHPYAPHLMQYIKSHSF